MPNSSEPRVENEDSDLIIVLTIGYGPPELKKMTIIGKAQFTIVEMTPPINISQGPLPRSRNNKAAAVI